MNKKWRPATRRVIDRHFIPSPTGSETPYFPVAKKSVAVDKFQEMKLDVIPHDAVGLDDGGRFAIDLIPGTPDLGAKPSSKRTEMFPELLPIAVRATHPFKLRQKLVSEIGSPGEFLATAAMPWFFANDFVHVITHT